MFQGQLGRESTGLRGNTCIILSTLQKCQEHKNALTPHSPPSIHRTVLLLRCAWSPSKLLRLVRQLRVFDESHVYVKTL